MTVQLPTVKCKRCPRLISWVKTTAGKAMPIDPEPTEAGNVIVRAEGGALVASVLVRSDTVRPQGVAFMPHWATCLGIPGNLDRTAKPAKAVKPEPEAPPSLF